MGEIYLAAGGEIGGLEKLCVIKKGIAERAEPAKAHRFLDEAKVVLRLSHANLVTTFDAGEVDGELYIAMELVEGKDLREVWNRCVRTRTRIPLDVALELVRQIARGLAYVHTHGDLGLVHRDVAPPNILLSYFGEVKLTDFGLARSVLKQEQTAPGVVFGRASYLAPEQARGEVADARADVYSLGIVMWELLTGQQYLQVAGLDPATALSLVRHPRPEPPSSKAPWIVPELDLVAMKALAPERDERFQSAEEMRRALSEAMAHVAPRADAERIAEFMRGLYGEVADEERAERGLLIKQVLPAFRDLSGPHLRTPSVSSDAMRTELAPSTGEPPAGGDAPAASGGGSAAASVAADAVVAPPLSDSVLHVSALRARAGSPLPREYEDDTGEGPTNVWRRRRVSAPPMSTEAFVGRIIDSRYRIERKVGEGGMGTVYLAEHVEIGKSVAVKILHPFFSGQQQLVERFRREARAASKIGHPNIVDVTDFGSTEEGCAYFVMEYLQGIDLADVLIHEKRIDVERALRIGVQICRALAAAHSTGVIHRDLKPENIFLVAREGQADFVKVLDFGIARSVSGGSRRLTNPGMAMGTPEYMAPEQSDGAPADERTDIYAVGALLYEMLTGVAPHASSSSPEELLQRKKRPPLPLREIQADVPESIDGAVLRALDPNPDRRPQTMTQLEYELTKATWGREQAVQELLGLRDNSLGRGYTPSQMSAVTPLHEGELLSRRDGERGMDLLEGRSTPLPARASEPSRETPSAWEPAFSPRAVGTPAVSFMTAALAAGTGSPVVVVAPTTSKWLRVATSAGILALGGLIAVVLYPRLPWGHGRELAASVRQVEPPPAVSAPPPTEPAAGRRHPESGTVNAVVHLADPSSPPSVGAPPALVAPKVSPLDAAERALDDGDVEGAVHELRRMVSGQRPSERARALLADTLVKAGNKALTERRRNDAATFSREAVALVKAGDKSDWSVNARILHGDVLASFHEYDKATDVIAQALADRPNDKRLKKRLMKLMKHVTQQPHLVAGAKPPETAIPALSELPSTSADEDGPSPPVDEVEAPVAPAAPPAAAAPPEAH
jgi:serine/threonine protein kinase